MRPSQRLLGLAGSCSTALEAAAYWLSSGGVATRSTTCVRPSSADGNSQRTSCVVAVPTCAVVVDDRDDSNAPNTVLAEASATMAQTIRIGRNPSLRQGIIAPGARRCQRQFFSICGIKRNSGGHSSGWCIVSPDLRRGQKYRACCCVSERGLYCPQRFTARVASFVAAGPGDERPSVVRISQEAVDYLLRFVARGSRGASLIRGLGRSLRTTLVTVRSQ